MQQTELTVEIFDEIDSIKTKLISKGFRVLETFSMKDVYLSKLPKTDIVSKSYEEMIKNSVVIRTLMGASTVNLILYKDKRYNNSGDVVAERKITCSVEDADKVEKILLNAGMESWCELVQNMTVFRNEDMQFVVQEVENLGTFIEYEEDEALKDLSTNQKIEKMKADLTSLGLNTGDNFFCKKIFMKIKKEN